MPFSSRIEGERAVTPEIDGLRSRRERRSLTRDEEIGKDLVNTSILGIDVKCSHCRREEVRGSLNEWSEGRRGRGGEKGEERLLPPSRHVNDT